LPRLANKLAKRAKKLQVIIVIKFKSVENVGKKVIGH
jgi:hypothetical protein